MIDSSTDHPERSRGTSSAAGPSTGDDWGRTATGHNHAAEPVVDRETNFLERHTQCSSPIVPCSRQRRTRRSPQLRSRSAVEIRPDKKTGCRPRRWLADPCTRFRFRHTGRRDTVSASSSRRSRCARAALRRRTSPSLRLRTSRARKRGRSSHRRRTPRRLRPSATRTAARDGRIRRAPTASPGTPQRPNHDRRGEHRLRDKPQHRNCQSCRGNRAQRRRPLRICRSRWRSVGQRCCNRSTPCRHTCLTESPTPARKSPGRLSEPSSGLPFRSSLARPAGKRKCPAAAAPAHA